MQRPLINHLAKNCEQKIIHNSHTIKRNHLHEMNRSDLVTQ